MQGSHAGINISAPNPSGFLKTSRDDPFYICLPFISRDGLAPSRSRLPSEAVVGIEQSEGELLHDDRGTSLVSVQIGLTHSGREQVESSDL